MFKNIITIASASMLLLSSCTKNESSLGSTDTEAAVSLTNVNGSSKTVNFFINGEKKTLAGTVSANNTILGTYVGLGSSTANTISLSDATVTTTEYFSGSFTTEPGKAYSFFAYDTLIAGKLKGLLLSTDRSVPTGNITTANVRFLNFSAKSPALELWMIRRVGGVAKDSVNIGNQPYMGSVAVPNVATLSAYTSIKASEVAGSAGVGVAASDYLIRLKIAGTSTIVSTSAATNIIPGRNYTIFARGTYPSSAVTLLLNN
ncbi:MAG: DUF4397 domain-containing protein [Ferruginibacter sp.]|nr:DUF4397 domain-containing protein [Ferruginibacter sp.]